MREVAATDAAMLERIGRLRVAVWEGEGTLSPAMKAKGVWLDEFDARCRHWVAEDAAGELVACARLSLHETLADTPDGYVWEQAGRTFAGPVANIAKLVVSKKARGQGLAGRMNQVRIEAARAAGARVVTVTASAANARLLERIGFEDTGIVCEFDNRPGFPFHALELWLE